MKQLALMSLVLAVLFAATAAQCATEQVLARFNSNNGSGPDYGPMVMDAQGNLYGTTDYGGGSPNCTYGCGTVFELVKGSTGKYTTKILHAFTGAPDGSIPSPGLAIDSAGNLYGVADYGGKGTNCTTGCGMVFELSLGATGHWVEHILYSFKGAPDASIPNGALTLDAAGNLYGTSWAGGSGTNCLTGCGTVFEIQKLSTGWREHVLYSFTQVPDGANPWADKLTFDSAGNLYGTTYYGGSNTNCLYGCGTVFELSPSGLKWTEKVIHAFIDQPDGALPLQGVLFDSAGNLYGTTQYGGDFTNCTLGCGTIFELSPNSFGTWSEKIVHKFEATTDGSIPFGALASDSNGNLYGTTFYGGDNTYCTTGCGTVFKLTPASGGLWQKTTVYAFHGAPDGSNPSGQLIFDTSGILYGTTYYGGNQTNCTYGCGTVFRILNP